MFHNLTNQPPILDKTPNLLGQRILHVVLLSGQINIDARALTRKDLCVKRVFREIHSGAIDLVEQNGGQGTEDLESEVGAFDDVDGANEGVNDEGGAGRVVEGEGVGFAVDADCGVFAAGDED